MKIDTFIPLLFLLFIIGCGDNSIEKDGKNTFCNPVNLSYRFQLDEPSRREAADPSVINYKGKYWMFLSKSGGYYHSSDLVNWELLSSTNLPIEEYAPTVVAIGDTILFMTKTDKIYKSTNPSDGVWEIANDSLLVRAFDPAFFLDDDGRLYLYHGLSARTPIKGIELNRSDLQPIGENIELLSSDKETYGWERPGDYNFGTKRRPWVEGAFVTKHREKYFLHYAVPGTQFKSYADGMYVSDKPLGPYKLAEHNPFSYKPEGFIAGAGHGSTFQDNYGNYWYAGTMTVAVKHRLERRIGLFPAFFDEDNTFYTYTGFGDFPHHQPRKKMESYKDYQPAYMLLSYNKPVSASSHSENSIAENAVDENIKTSWSALFGDKGEWLMVDLESERALNAIQVNFADGETEILGRPDGIYYQYLVEYSNDSTNWKTLIDKTQNKKDSPHDYCELPKTVNARFVRITNYHVPDGKFAISGFRIFGWGNGEKPEPVKKYSVVRDSIDACIVKLNWGDIQDATGYNVRYGTAPDKLYLNHQVLGTDSVVIRSLNSLQDYYFTIDAFNENGITAGQEIVKVPVATK